MSARRVLNMTELMLRESNTPEEVEEMLDPPPPDREGRLDQLRSLGIEVA